MQKNYKIATIFGGTGFIGAQIVREMASKGWLVKVVTRVPEKAYFLKPCGTVGQIVPINCDYNDQKTLSKVIRDSDYVVNCIGTLFDRRKSKFTYIHKELPENIAKACKKEGVSRFVHISALGCDKSESKYAKSKRDGEKAILKAFPKATILRPSVVFGPKDEFFNMFAEMARYLPFLPLIGGGKTKFQPVYVGDVADAALSALTLPDEKKGPCGEIYELGGPEIVSFKQIYDLLFKYTGRKRLLVVLPWGIAKIQAGFMSILPRPPLTPDQVRSLKTDNVVSKKALTLSDLGVENTAMGTILPTYLEQFRPGGRFSDKKRA